MSTDENKIEMVEISDDGIETISDEKILDALSDTGDATDVFARIKERQARAEEERYKALTYAIESKLATTVQELIYIAARIEAYVDSGELPAPPERKKPGRKVGQKSTKKAAKKAAPKKAVKKIIKKATVGRPPKKGKK